MEAEVNDACHETELDGAIVELIEEVNSVTDRQMKGHSDSSNNVAMSANQFHDFMSTVILVRRSTLVPHVLHRLST